MFAQAATGLMTPQRSAEELGDEAGRIAGQAHSEGPGRGVLLSRRSGQSFSEMPFGGSLRTANQAWSIMELSPAMVKCDQTSQINPGNATQCLDMI